MSTGATAMVLAAGFGTRLRPLTERICKPMVPLLDRPLASWALCRLRAAGVTQVVVNAHHLPEQVVAWAARDPEGVEVAVRVESPAILGTGGALRNARPVLARSGPVVVVNGDSLHDVDVAAVLAGHRARGAVATLVALPDVGAEAYGALEMNDEGWLTRVANFIGSSDVSRAKMIFVGVHVVEQELMDAIPPEGAPDILRTAYAEMYRRGRPIRVHRYEGPFFDLGTPARYLAAHRAALVGGLVDAPERDHVAASARVDRTAHLVAPCYVGAGAVIEAGARVGPYASVGAGARVGANAVVTEAAVLPGTQVAPGETVQDVLAAQELRLR